MLNETRDRAVESEAGDIVGLGTRPIQYFSTMNRGGRGGLVDVSAETSSLASAGLTVNGDTEGSNAGPPAYVNTDHFAFSCGSALSLSRPPLSLSSPN
ncbi:hypothetical protein CRG98_047904 [Punica granatum]|uniref:Uncharacterized protein n=1 Tax=Punica granatum TaxID=22663 RepID=A0A2I0HJ30_PUNGR|nr:hypothetical protein CRG98_047904 [Punica granatum]